ncbi:Peptidase A22B signal peptide peptidase [Trinorchestia longiramus]|nr:Peptidase A22B signal peptide peptidase [Trinorchestia longiramus]
MAESVVEEVAKVIVENATEAVKNGTAKEPATPEGILLAYSSLVIMAILPIFFGSYRSISFQEQQKAAGEKLDTVTSKDAAMFPLIASCALFGLYLVFTIFSKEYINLLLSSYFFFLGICAMAHVFSPFISRFVPASIPYKTYKLVLDCTSPSAPQQGDNSKEKEQKQSLIDFSFSTHDFVVMILCSVVGVWYILKKHWIANNLLGLAFAVNGIELLSLNSVTTGALLLSGLFVYDIFWVFGTNVMVTVAKSFEAPIKLVFPQDLLEKGVLQADNFAMLGLGDIVIPGIFIALLLRFDKSLKRGSHTYFNATIGAYFAGLLATILVMHVFKHAQPALLYLVPACLGVPTLLAAIKGDFNTLVKYEDSPTETEPAKALTEDQEEGAEGDVSKRVTRADTRKEK